METIDTQTPNRDRLQALRRQYRSSLTIKADDLSACWDELCGAEEPLVSLERMRTLVHRLAGSAGMYGFPDLSRRARCLLGLLYGLSYPFVPQAHTRAARELDLLLHELRYSGAPRVFENVRQERCAEMPGS